MTTPINVATVVPLGIGPAFQQFTDTVMTVPASRTGVLFIWNQAPGTLVVTVVIPDPGPDSLGDRILVSNMASGAQRFHALSPKLADPVTGLISLNMSGDRSAASGFALERVQS